MPGLLRGVARVGIAAGTATAVSNRVSRRQAQRWGEQEAAEQQQYQQPPPQYQQAAAPPAPAGDDPRIIQLQQLAELKGQGILTDEEFAAQKARILG